MNVGNLIAFERVYFFFLKRPNTFQSAVNHMVPPPLHPNYISKGFFLHPNEYVSFKLPQDAF